MPIYEYACSVCGHKLETLQRLADAPLVTCPACGKDALSKSVTAAGFQLKGSGWYATDFRNSGAKPAPQADKDAPKAETKPDAPAASGTQDSGSGKVESKTVTNTETNAADKGTASVKTTSPRGS